MNANLLQQKTTAFDEKQAAMKSFWDKHAENAESLSNEQRQEIDTINKEAKDLITEISELKEFQEAYKKAEEFQKLIHKPLGAPEFPNGDPRLNIKADLPETAANIFVNDDRFKKWLDLIAPKGSAVADGMELKSPAVETKSLVYSSSTSGGAMVRRDYYPTVELPLRPLSILDVVTHIPTTSNLIEYVRVTALTRAAAITPEATATSSTGYSNAAKPEAGMTLEIVQTAVKTIPVWMPVTRQILQDVPQLQAMIENFLRMDTELALEDEIVTGAGGSSHFVGLDNTPGLTPQPYDSAGEPLLTTTRKARTKVRTIGRANPTAYLLNPYDWESIDLTRANNGAFYFGGPMQMGQKMLWGLPVIECEGVPQGTGFVGDLRQIVVWDRESSTIRITDSHSDFFTHNMIAVLAELRAAMGVLRPAAIVKMDFVAGANS